MKHFKILFIGLFSLLVSLNSMGADSTELQKQSCQNLKNTPYGGGDKNSHFETFGCQKLIDTFNESAKESLQDFKSRNKLTFTNYKQCSVFLLNADKEKCIESVDRIVKKINEDRQAFYGALQFKLRSLDMIYTSGPNRKKLKGFDSQTNCLIQPEKKQFIRDSKSDVSDCAWIQEKTPGCFLTERPINSIYKPSESALFNDRNICQKYLDANIDMEPFKPSYKQDEKENSSEPKQTLKKESSGNYCGDIDLNNLKAYHSTAANTDRVVNCMLQSDGSENASEKSSSSKSKSGR